MPKDLSDLQKNYDLFLTTVLRTSKFFTFNPENLNSEKIKFGRNKKYSPLFEYSGASKTSKMYENILSGLRFKDSTGNKIINDWLVEKKKELLDKLILADSVGTPALTKKSINVYGKPSASLINKAEEILQEEFKVKRKSYIKSEEVMRQLRQTFRDLKISGWKIKKADLITSAYVSCESKKFVLRKRERMQQDYIERLKIHEIGTHVVRFENGSLQPLSILKYGLKDYLSTEEGLAMYAEEISGVLSPSIKRNYAGRVLATKFALESGFRETYKNLLEYFSPKVAFKLTLRAKRGLSDTSEPGGLTKDYCYLKGYFKVKSFAKRNDLKDLYIGKIGVKDARKIKKLGLIRPPIYLPKYLREENDSSI